MENLNINIDNELKVQAENIFNGLGLSMAAAINIFFRAVVREKNFPLALNVNVPNEITRAAIEEGRKIFDDPSVKGYKNMAELRAALEK